jgi:2-hydroxy-6-oxonona-2,4-dienedioate hydrolase
MGFTRAIANRLVLQDPVARADFAWEPGWVGKITAPTLLLWTDHDPTGGLVAAGFDLWLAYPLTADHGFVPSYDLVSAAATRSGPG